MDIRRLIARALSVVVVVGLSACAANETVKAPVQTDGTGPAATVLAVTGGQQAGCVTERATVETAIEAYFAINGSDPATLDDLVPDMLKESVSARWSMQANPAGGSPILTGIGECTGA